TTAPPAKPKRTRNPKKADEPATKIAFAEPTSSEIGEEIYMGCEKGVPYPTDAPGGYNTLKLILPADGNKAVIMPAAVVYSSFSLIRIIEDLKKSFSESGISAVDDHFNDVKADPKCFV